MNLYELIGIILGDGYILYNTKKSRYRFEIYGNAEEDKFYLQQISKFIKSLGFESKLFVKFEKLGKCLRLTVNKKAFVEYVIKNLKIPYKNKTFEGFIPDEFVDWKLSKHIIRGLLETDGSIYFSRITPKKRPTYPRLEIKTSSKKLSEQIFRILQRKAFKVRIRTCKSDKTYGIYLSGPIMLEKWKKEIGFSSIKNTTKYLFWKKYKYYIPYLKLSKRIKLLNAEAQAPCAEVPHQRLQTQAV